MTEDESKLLCEPDSLSPIGADRREYFVRFGTSKQNYGGRLDDIWYMRKKGGVLVPVALREPGRPASAIDAPRGAGVKVSAKVKQESSLDEVLKKAQAQAVEGDWVDLPRKDGNGGWK